MLDLHDLLWTGYIGGPITEAGVADAMTEFERLSHRHEDLLPDGAWHLRRSVRQAMACALGAPAVAALHARAKQEPFDTLDGYWADVSLTWLEHAARRLHDWEDQPQSRRVDLVPYDEWRRDEDKEAHANGTILPSFTGPAPPQEQRTSRA